jgi:hypothetical protein
MVETRFIASPTKSSENKGEFEKGEKVVFQKKIKKTEKQKKIPYICIVFNQGKARIRWDNF